jgi:hypothetical protein
METFSPMPHADNLSRVLLALILLCLAVVILRDGGGSSCSPGDRPAEAAALRTHGERFATRIIGLQRKPPLMLRTDSATGEAWMMGVQGPGRWEALREGPEGAPSAGAEEAGRYEIVAVNLRRGAPNLVRTDLRTGRVWRKGATNGGSWVAVPNPGKAPRAAAKPAARPAATPTPTPTPADGAADSEGRLEAEEAGTEDPGDAAE